MHYNMLRKAYLGMAAGFMLGALGASSVALMAETPKDVFVAAMPIDGIVSLDPQEAYEFDGLNLLNNVYDGLVEIDPATDKADLVPGLAQSWSVDPDGKTYRFEMRPNVTFSSGNPVRAEDAVFSLKRGIKLNKPPAFILQQFGWTVENIDQMVMAEGNNVILKTGKVVSPSFVFNCLTSIVGAVVDEKTVMSHEVNGDMGNEWLKTNSAGTGAYILKSYKPDEGYVLVARQGHWRGDAFMKTILVRHVLEGATKRLLLEKNDIDFATQLTTVDIEALKKNPDILVESDAGGLIFFIAFNQKNELYKNPKFLEAMRRSIDYQGIEKTVLKDAMVVRQTFLPKGFLGALDENPYKFDPEKAKALLAEIGAKDVHFTLELSGIPARVEIAQSIQNTMGQVGVKVDLKQSPVAELLERYRAKLHDVTLQGWGPDYPDPHTNASTFVTVGDQSTGSSSMAMRNSYEPGELQTLTEAALVELDTQKRKDMYEEIQRRHRDTSPFIMMFQENQQFAMRKNVTGFSSGGAFSSYAFWLVKK